MKTWHMPWKTKLLAIWAIIRGKSVIANCYFEDTRPEPMENGLIKIEPMHQSLHEPEDNDE